MVQRFACDDEPTPRDNGLAPRLLKARTILLTGEIDHELAERVVAQLLILDAESKIITVGAGWVVSMAVPILLGAQKENRLSLPNTRFMIHQPIGGVGGQATDVRIAAQEIIKIRERINHLFAAETGQPLEKIAADSDRNFWLSAEEARQYGLVSRIIQSARDI